MPLNLKCTSDVFPALIIKLTYFPLDDTSSGFVDPQKRPRLSLDEFLPSKNSMYSQVQPGQYLKRKSLRNSNSHVMKVAVFPYHEHCCSSLKTLCSSPHPMSLRLSFRLHLSVSPSNTRGSVGHSERRET